MKPANHNPIAMALRHGQFHIKKVKPKVGKRAYKRPTSGDRKYESRMD